MIIFRKINLTRLGYASLLNNLTIAEKLMEMNVKRALAPDLDELVGPDLTTSSGGRGIKLELPTLTIQ